MDQAATYPATAYTARVLDQARARGFRIVSRLAGGRVTHYLDQPGKAGTFGALYVGARTGRITGGHLNRGNADDRGTPFHGAIAIARAIRSSPTVGVT